MKKKLSLLLCLLLTLAMTFAMVGCGEKDDDDDDRDSKKKQESVKDDDEDEETVVGEWEAEIDMLDYMLEMMGGDEMADYIGMDEFIVTLYMEFDEDGDYKVSFDTDSMKDQLITMMENLMETMMEEAAEEADMTVDELLEEAGYADMDEAIEEAIEEADLDSIIDEMGDGDKGTYEWKDDTLVLEDASEWTIKFSGGSKFKVTEVDGDDDLEACLPITFERQ